MQNIPLRRGFQRKLSWPSSRSPAAEARANRRRRSQTPASGMVTYWKRKLSLHRLLLPSVSRHSVGLITRRTRARARRRNRYPPGKGARSHTRAPPVMSPARDPSTVLQSVRLQGTDRSMRRVEIIRRTTVTRLASLGVLQKSARSPPSRLTLRETPTNE